MADLVNKKNPWGLVYRDLGVMADNVEATWPEWVHRDAVAALVRNLKRDVDHLAARARPLRRQPGKERAG